MEWVVIIGLGVWVWLQSRRIDALTHQLRALASQRAAPQSTSTAPPAASPIRSGELEPLLLDTPLPEASNDAEFAPPAPAARSASPPPKPSSREFERWLAENGLAWLAGGAIALGAIFLVGYAAQQNWFTARVRLMCALLLGVALIAASAWARRVGLARPPGHPLAAALLAGAGAASFYAAAWAAHGLYHLIDWPLAAALLTLCALALAALSFMHGAALGALALAAALLAPALASAALWPSAALTLYVCAVSAAGLALAAWRRWAWTAAATIAGLYFWFAAALSGAEIARALTFLSFASVGGLAMAARAPARDAPAAPLNWARVHALAPIVALCLSAVLTVWTWLAVASGPASAVAGPALIAIFHAGLGAYAVRARAAPPATFAAAVGALVAGAALYAAARAPYAPLASAFYSMLQGAGLAVVAAALGARPHHSGRALTAATGALGAALLVTLAAFTRQHWHSLAAWAGLFAGAALLFCAALAAAREAPAQTRDNAVDCWAGAGAALLLLGVESAFPASVRAAAHAGAALLLASGFAWRGWRAVRFAALSAAALALAQALAPELAGAALTGGGTLWRALAILGLAAALLLAASRLAKPRDSEASMHEALHSAAVLIAIIAAFVALRWFAAGGAGAALDAFAEASLQALALTAAGYVLKPRPGAQIGFIARWRGHLLMGAGLLYALSGPALAFNPWWGEAPALIAGPPLLNAQALAFAAPAALALLSAIRADGGVLMRCYAVAGGLLALTWISLEVRHGFHGARMSGLGFVSLEGFAHALWPLALVVAGGVLTGRGANTQHTEFARRLCGVAVWPALAIAALGLWLWHNPWWGAAPAQASGTISALFGLGGYGLAAWLSARVGDLPGARWPALLAPSATVAAIAHLLVAATLIVRRLFHGADMSAPPASDVEMWTYSAVWALFGAGVFGLGMRRGAVVLRWAGLATLVGATIYVVFLALTRLQGMVRVGSLLGLAIVLFVVTWAARTHRQATPQD